MSTYIRPIDIYGTLASLFGCLSTFSVLRPQKSWQKSFSSFPIWKSPISGRSRITDALFVELICLEFYLNKMQLWFERRKIFKINIQLSHLLISNPFSWYICLIIFIHIQLWDCHLRYVGSRSWRKLRGATRILIYVPRKCK